eukprot:scaffold2284_cov402-Prasinococcus_capsulatus_cf.AAC.9
MNGERTRPANGRGGFERSPEDLLPLREPAEPRTDRQAVGMEPARDRHAAPRGSPGRGGPLALAGSVSRPASARSAARYWRGEELDVACAGARAAAAAGVAASSGPREKSQAAVPAVGWLPELAAVEVRHQRVYRFPSSNAGEARSGTETFWRIGVEKELCEPERMRKKRDWLLLN